MQNKSERLGFQKAAITKEGRFHLSKTILGWDQENKDIGVGRHLGLLREDTMGEKTTSIKAGV